MSNPEVLLILDNSLRMALITFLALFFVFLLYALWRRRRVPRDLGDLIEEEIEPQLSEGLLGQSEPRQASPPVARNFLRTALRALILASGLATLSFFVYGFAPLPYLHNFATERSWQTQPLRLTALKFERFHEGFSLEGEVWNQTREPIEGLRAIIKIRDRNRDLLDAVEATVRPQPLGPGRKGDFQFRYTENSAFLWGYQVEFHDAQDDILPHVEGFDIR